MNTLMVLNSGEKIDSLLVSKFCMALFYRNFCPQKSLKDTIEEKWFDFLKIALKRKDRLEAKKNSLAKFLGQVQVDRAEIYLPTLEESMLHRRDYVKAVNLLKERKLISCGKAKNKYKIENTSIDHWKKVLKKKNHTQSATEFLAMYNAIGKDMGVLGAICEKTAEELFFSVTLAHKSSDPNLRFHKGTLEKGASILLEHLGN